MASVPLVDFHITLKCHDTLLLCFWGGSLLLLLFLFKDSYVLLKHTLFLHIDMPRSFLFFLSFHTSWMCLPGWFSFFTTTFVHNTLISLLLLLLFPRHHCVSKESGCSVHVRRLNYDITLCTLEHTRIYFSKALILEVFCPARGLLTFRDLECHFFPPSIFCTQTFVVQWYGH